MRKYFTFSRVFALVAFGITVLVCLAVENWDHRMKHLGEPNPVPTETVYVPNE